MYEAVHEQAVPRSNFVQRGFNHAWLKSAQLTPHLTGVLRRQTPQALWGGAPYRRQVALTFDDGPHQVDTPRLLAALARLEVKATFFNIGERVEREPALVRSIAKAGHGLGLHGYYHQPLPLVSPMQLRYELARARHALGEASGRPAAQLRDVRPPFGVYTPHLLRQLHHWGYRPVMWGVVPVHWLQTDAAPAIEQVVTEAAPGALIVLHEGLGGPPVAGITEAVVSRLQELNYEFITVGEMWAR